MNLQRDQYVAYPKLQEILDAIYHNNNNNNHHHPIAWTAEVRCVSQVFTTSTSLGQFNPDAEECSVPSNDLTIYSQILILLPEVEQLA